MRRRNGFQWPLNLHQLAVTATLVALSVCFFVVLAPMLRPRGIYIGVQALYAALAAATALLVAITTGIDAADPGAPPRRSGRPSFHCTHCEVLVRAQSKHCRRCNKCVEEFDHHCVFLNNCIGAHNYGYFLALLCTTTAAAALHAGTATYLLTHSFTAASSTRAALGRLYGGGLNLTAFRVVAGVSAVLALGVVVLVAELLVFHVILHWRGQSTFEYITQRRAAKEARAAAVAVAAAESKAWSGLSDVAKGDVGDVGSSAGCCCSPRSCRQLLWCVGVQRCHPAGIEPYPVTLDDEWTPRCADVEQLPLGAGSQLIRVLPATEYNYVWV